MGPRPAFLALARVDGEDATAARWAGRVAELERMDGWRAAGAAGPWRVWTTGEAPLPVRALGAHGLLVGDLFEHPAAPDGAGPGCEASAAAAAQRLCRAHWGRYVALLADADGPAVLRDPGGGLAALVWTPGPGLRIVASELAPVPAGLRPAWCGLDWDRIAAFLARPASGMARSLLEGIEAVAPGELRRVGRRGPGELIWNPADFARRALDPRCAAPALVRRVDAAVAALVGRHEQVLMELSGGLDSAIVAGALGALGLDDRVAVWLNWSGEREGDERAYARAVTDRLGVALTALPKRPAPLALEDLAETADGLWPAMSGPDSARDREETEILARCGASAILSGQGGDATFYQMRSAAVLADAWRGQGAKALRGPLLADLARRTQASVWRVLAQARAAGRGRDLHASAGSSLVPAALRAASAGEVHPWVAAARAGGTPPGKQFQVQALANCQLYHGDSRRRRAAELVFPLLAQPVVELALAIPSWDLAGGAHDRMYARAAFADRIPEAVRRRRAKGALGAYFGKLVALSAASLRPYLLDGCLAEAGLLDREAVARALEPEAMMRDGRPTEVMWAAAVEAWVRHWQTRVPDSLSAPRPQP